MYIYIYTYIYIAELVGANTQQLNVNVDHNQLQPVLGH